MLELVSAVFMMGFGLIGLFVSIFFELASAVALFCTELFFDFLDWVMEQLRTCLELWLFVPESIHQVIIGTYTMDLWQVSMDLVPSDQSWNGFALGTSLTFLLMGLTMTTGQGQKSQGSYGAFFGLLPIGITLLCVDFSLGLFVTLWMVGNLWIFGKILNSIADGARGRVR